MKRLRLQIQGRVQGVGFRPLVWGLARELQLAGFVRNDAGGVTVELQGPEPRLEDFCAGLTRRLPPHALIEQIERELLELQKDEDFRILPSLTEPGQGAMIPADLAPCADCLRELHDPSDRRYGYPFLNCTNCGPRYTITRQLPYDRAQTTMASFPLCEDCRQEYEDPSDRRFHAQPVACPRCGPQLSKTIPELLAVLERGQVLALKGVGGYHLLCRAHDLEAVARLRELKNRPDRPLALMVPTLQAARALVHLTPEMESLLESPARPILLAPARQANAWAPRLNVLGLMLPYSPLHVLLCREPLVATSANRSGEPICYSEDSRLEGMADVVAHHDRPIAVACDDSVVAWGPRGPIPVRRSRGQVPDPIGLPHDTVPTLATGGELKCVLAVTRGRQAILSGHIGDVENHETLLRLELTARHLEQLLAIRIERIACDMHPGYLSSAWARRQGLEWVEVQHHHAHLASLLAEHGRTEPILGLIMDGTGFGTDGSIWGGEALRGNARGFERVASFRGLPLRGGDQGVRNPCRQALEALFSAGIELHPRLPCVQAARGLELRNVGRGPVVQTSSLGRLFDVVSSLLGFCHRTTYEGQAAIELEAAATSSDRSLPFPLDDHRIDWRPALAELAQEVLRGAPAGELSARFHNGLADLMRQLADRYADGLPVGLSGGCFQNLRLLSATLERLPAHEVLIHRLVPPNDGGIALGQALVANAR